MHELVLTRQLLFAANQSLKASVLRISKLFSYQLYMALTLHTLLHEMYFLAWNSSVDGVYTHKTISGCSSSISIQPAVIVIARYSSNTKCMWRKDEWHTQCFAVATLIGVTSLISPCGTSTMCL